MNEEVFKDLIVVKRSGQRVSFNGKKIALAIKNAFDQVLTTNNEKHINKVYKEVLEYISKNYNDRKTINVEDIQDIIEKKLKDNKYNNVYEAFSEYRIRRSIFRKAFNIKPQHKFTKAIERIVNDSKENYYINNYSDEILLDFGKTISCEYAKTFVLDNKLVRAHEEGSIYIHNLDYFWLGKISSTNIMLNSEMYKNFPNNFITKLLNLKNEIDGEIAINSFDSVLKPIIISKFCDKFYENIIKYLKITGFIDYINIEKLKNLINNLETIDINEKLFESYFINDQTKRLFNIALDDTLKYVKDFIYKSIHDILIILNSNRQENRKYSISIGSRVGFEENLVNNIYLEELESLNYLENISTIFKISKKCSADLINKVVQLILKKKNIALTFVETDYNTSNGNIAEYFGDGKKIFESLATETNSSLGRMIVSSISINTARLGLLNEGKSLEKFYESFDEVLHLTKNGLISIFETIGDKSKNNYREIFKDNIVDDNKLAGNQKIRKIIKKGVLNLELAGLKECVMCLTDDEGKQKKLVIDIINYSLNKCVEYSKETKLNFVISETSKFRPLKKLIELDKAIYGEKKGITDKRNYERIDSMFDFKKELENDLKYIGDYQKVLNGGNLLKIKLNKNIKAKNIMEIIEMCKNSNIGFVKLVVGDEVEV